ncbi:hypothetical protein KSF78_0006191 [Schistosoma japonicum]|nr:hypothetical protein KSF78_0006191 [Schistosoma japonicum]
MTIYLSSDRMNYQKVFLIANTAAFMITILIHSVLPENLELIDNQNTCLLKRFMCILNLCFRYIILLNLLNVYMIEKRCNHGVCNQGKCLCDNCWQGEFCEISVSNNIRFTSNIFKFTVTQRDIGIPNIIIGRLTFRHLGNVQFKECEQVYFKLESVHNESLPIYVENSTGFVRLSSLSNYNWSRILYQKIYMTVKLFDSYNKEIDTSQILIFWKYFTTNDQIDDFQKNAILTNSNLHLERFRRSVNPITSMQILVTRSDAANNPLCPTEIIALSVQLGVPAGTTTITVEVFAPTKDSIFYGFVEFIDISYIGVRISPRNFAISIRNTSLENVYEYKIFGKDEKNHLDLYEN